MLTSRHDASAAAPGPGHEGTGSPGRGARRPAGLLRPIARSRDRSTGVRLGAPHRPARDACTLGSVGGVGARGRTAPGRIGRIGADTRSGLRGGGTGSSRERAGARGPDARARARPVLRAEHPPDEGRRGELLSVPLPSGTMPAEMPDAGGLRGLARARRNGRARVAAGLRHVERDVLPAGAHPRARALSLGCPPAALLRPRRSTVAQAPRTPTSATR